MGAWIFEALATSHDRSSFSSGQLSLDEFIQARVSQYQKRNLGQTFVAVLQGTERG